MVGFIIRRILWTIPVLLLVILMTFLMMRHIQGNPFRHSERAVSCQLPQTQSDPPQTAHEPSPGCWALCLWPGGGVLPVSAIAALLVTLAWRHRPM